MGTAKTLAWVGAFVLFNNAAWLYYTDTRSTALAVTSSTQTIPATSLKIAQPALIHQQAEKTGLSIKNIPASKPVLAPITAPKPLDLEANLPVRESEELIADQAFSKETFAFDSEEHKLATIEQLTPQGEDLIFLQKIIESPESEAIKRAAIERLSGQQQFGALNTAIKVLEKNNATLSFAALGVLKNSHDISLIPQLRSQSQKADNEALKQEIDATIGFLEGSVSMGMDSAEH
ncbi:MAG TPA: hypothetical protein VIZ65_12035 [Cellvibrionaceae bacterium]